MILRRLIPVIIIFLFSHLALANQQIAILIGGGGNPESDAGRGQQDDMLATTARAANVLSRLHYKIGIVFGDQKDLMALTNKINDKSAILFQRPFNQKSMADTLGEIEMEIESGVIKSGDRLVFQINTHGLPARKNELTHSVALKGGKLVLFSLDHFTKLKNLILENKIDSFIIDLSCYSGATLNLSGTTISVVSISNAFNFGQQTPHGNGFGDDFWQTLDSHPTMSLEELFLASRLAHKPVDTALLPGFAIGRAHDLPEISSRIHFELRYAINLFFKDYKLGWGGLSETLEIPSYRVLEASRFYGCQVCRETPATIEKLITNLQSWGAFPKNSITASTFVELAQRYDRERRLYERINRAFAFLEATPLKMENCHPYLDNKNYSELPEMLERARERLRNGSTPDHSDEKLVNREKLKSGLCTSPSTLLYMRNHKSDFDMLRADLNQGSALLERTITAMVKIERNAYDQLYREELNADLRNPSMSEHARNFRF